MINNFVLMDTGDYNVKTTALYQFTTEIER